jgi:hypothetical protein
MSEPMLFGVVTTIREPTACLRVTKAALDAAGGKLVVVGDRKGPASFEMAGVDFHSLEAQRRLPYALAGQLPVGHYARKNLGYLVAIRDGAGCIYETDDDNAPLPGWRPRTLAATARRAEPAGWINVFRHFTDKVIWPRGFPIALVRETGAPALEPGGLLHEAVAPIQQGLVDESPDVDAIWRLGHDRDFRFGRNDSIWLPPGAWCPFNTQSTWWWPVAWPLMYCPSHCSFRMTDIWRGFIAQRCIWELGCGLVFHAPEVRQDRNPHDLMTDFREEVPGYLGNEEIVRLLGEMRLAPGEDAVGPNMRACYERLVEAAFFPEAELPLVGAWLSDLRDLRGRAR